MSTQEINNSFLNTPFNGFPSPSVSIHNFNENNNFIQDETNNLIYNLTIDIKNLSFVYDDTGDNNNILKHIKLINSSIGETVEKINNIVESKIQHTRNYAMIENYLNDIQFNINQDLTINLTVILKPLELQEEEQPKLINYSCFCCSDDFENAEIIKYCNNLHSDRVCLACYKNLKSRGVKCPICRGQLFKYVKNSNADLLRIYEGYKTRILDIKHLIFRGLIDYNRAQENKINDTYFIYNDNIILTYPFKLGVLNYNFNLNSIVNNPYNLLTEEINNIDIEAYSDYQSLDYLILKCINNKLFLTFNYEEGDDEDEEDAENQKEDLNLITGAMLKIFNELEDKLYEDKIIITTDRFNYRFRPYNALYLFYYYMSFIKNKSDATKNKLLLLVKADYLANNLKNSDINTYKFKYNNVIHNIKLEYDNSINIYVCKRIKAGKNYKYDMEHIREYNLNIKDYSTLEDDFKETISDAYRFSSLLYDYLDGSYPLSLRFHNMIIEKLNEEEDGEAIGLYWAEQIEPHLNIGGLFNYYLDNEERNIIELMTSGDTNYYLDGVEDLNYICIDGGFLEYD